MSLAPCRSLLYRRSPLPKFLYVIPQRPHSTVLPKIEPSTDIPPRLLSSSLSPSTPLAQSSVPENVYSLPAPSPPPIAPTHFPRLARLKSAKPFSQFLTDSFSRQHTYLRISITERCNLRCLYCMPAAGVQLSPADYLLSTPEILELSSFFVGQGVTKIRLTGGEPTVRKDVVELVEALGLLRPRGLDEIAITSNGVALSERKLRRMFDAGLTGLNLSLDTLVPAKFEFMTRRKGLERVLATVDSALGMGFGDGKRNLKINVVVMKGVNEDEIIDFVNMTQKKRIEVRFIEYMPFDGNKWAQRKMFSFASMLSTIRAQHPSFALLPHQRPNDTAKIYHVPGFTGTIGFITSMTENFCGTCNRLRITCDGNIKVCLFGKEEVSLRDILRKYRAPADAVGSRNAAMEKELLGVVGGAVGRKEVGHKPAEELAATGGRPMILIGG